MHFAIAKHYADGLRLAPELFSTIKEAWDWAEENLGGIRTHVVQLAGELDEEEFVVSTFHSWLEDPESGVQGKTVDAISEQYSYIEFYTRERIEKAMHRYNQELSKIASS